MSKEIVYFVGLLNTMKDWRSDEKKMVENSTVGVAYSYYTVYNIDDIEEAYEYKLFLRGASFIFPQLEKYEIEFEDYMRK